jgi:hypothetical protein
MNSRVFVSYSHQDAALVDRLVHDLEANRISVWLDVKEIEIGGSLTRALEGALANCSAIVLVLSSHSVSSAWVQREYRAAVQLQKADEEGRPLILPALADDCEVPVFLRDILWADFRSGYEGAFRKMVRRLGVTEPQIPSVDFGRDLQQLLAAVEGDFGCLLDRQTRGSVPSHDLFDKWCPHEAALLRLLSVEQTSARLTRLDRTRWQLGKTPDATGRVPLDDEPWPRADFYLSVCHVTVEVLQLAARYGLRPSLPLALEELFKMTGAEFRD